MADVQLLGNILQRSDTMAKVQKTYRLDSDLLGILHTMAAETGDGETSALEELIAGGLKLRMMQNEPSVHPHFLDRLSTAGVISEYRGFEEAVCGRLGVAPVDGRPIRHRFEQAPAGGRWEQLGLAGAWAVLAENEHFTPDGIERTV